MKRICTIHNDKPDVCKNCPSQESELLAFPNCSLYFKDGKLQGECNQCGDCCLKPHITPPGYDRKFTNETCPYLKEVNGD